MHKRAGLLFLAKTTGRILLIHENNHWTVPTFTRNTVLLEDTADLLENYSKGKILPIELYLSEDKGFEYGTYVCLVDSEFLTETSATICWASLFELPKKLHTGLEKTLNNVIIQTKIKTILELKL
jgi:hypothetical protein